MNTTVRNRSLALIFGHTVRGFERSLAWWSAFLFLFSLGVVLVFTRGGAAGPLAVTLCPADGAGPLTLDAWLNMELFSWLPLIVGLYGVMVTCRAIAGPMDDGSMEILMSGPLPPRVMVWGRMLPVASALLILHLSAMLGITLAFVVSGVSPPLALYASVLAHSLILTLVFSAASLVLSIITRRLGSALAYSGGFILMSFVFDLVLRGAGVVEGWRLVTPFGYYASCQILAGTGMLSFNLIYLSGWLALLLASGLHLFTHRDMV